MLKKIGYGLGISLMTCQFLWASVASPSVYDFTLLAGGTLTTGSGVVIGGKVGSADALYLGQGTMLNGDAYTSGTFGVNRNVAVSGRVVAAGDISIGSQSSTGALDSQGNVGLENNALVQGNIASGGRVSIGSGAAVSGNVSYTTGYWADRSATIGGTAGEGISAVSIWNYSGLSAPTNWTTGSQYLYYASGSSQVLSPGDYAGMSVSDRSELYLTAGTYNFADVWLGKEVKMIADTSAGEVVINVAGSLNTGSGVRIGGQGDDSFVLNSKGSISLGSDSKVDADLYAYGSSMTIGKDSAVTGRLYSAGSLYLADKVNVKFSRPVPEPVSLVLLATGILMIAGRRMKTRGFCDSSAQA